MISSISPRHAQIRDIDPAGWINLLSLADPHAVRLLAGDSPRPTAKKTRLTVIFEGHRVMKSYHSEEGPILKGLRWNEAANLKDIAHRAKVQSVVAIERGALGRINKVFQQPIKLRGNYVTRLHGIYDAVRHEIDKGLHFYPPLRLKPIRHELIQDIYKLLIPHNSTVVFYVFDGNRVWSSVIIGVGDKDIDMFSSHSSLVDGDVSISNWREEYPRILSVVGRKFRHPSIGIFCELMPLAKVIRAGQKLAALALAREEKDIIIDPLPLRIKVVLGAGRMFDR